MHTMHTMDKDEVMDLFTKYEAEVAYPEGRNRLMTREDFMNWVETTWNQCQEEAWA